MRQPSLTPWRKAWIILACSLLLLIIVYSATAAAMMARWSADPLGHGYLVLPAAAYLAWARRGSLASLSPTPTFSALPFLAALVFLGALGSLTNTAVIQQVSLVGMVIGVVWGVLGTKCVRALLFPLAFLMFAVPLGDRLVPALQELTARFAVKMLELSDVPVLLQGHVISIPGGTWNVAEACSGINYLVSSLAIGYLYAGTAYRSWVHRVGFFLASALLPLAANGLRVYTTILIASVGGSRIVAGMEHYLYGWLVFAMIMGLLFATCGGWREEPREKAATPPGAGSGMSDVPRWSPAYVALLGILLVGVVPGAASSVGASRAVDEFARPQSPGVSLPWKAVEHDHTWRPRFVAPSAEFLQTYESGSDRVTLYVASYGADRPDVKLASVSNVLFEDPWWAAGSRVRTVDDEGQSIAVRETRLEAPAASLVVWNWYSVDGEFTGNDYVAKLLLAKSKLLHRRGISAAIAVSTDNRHDRAVAVLQDFLDHLSLTDSLGLPPRAHAQ